MENWIDLNRENWDERAEPHAQSPGYGVEQFVADPTKLSGVVQFDLPRLGDVQGLRGLHLQCHIGTDTLSLHRLGAQMTGLDFSGAALEQARSLAERTGAEIDYVQGEVYDTPNLLPPGSFDLVFTGIGALCWLPDIQRWADVVAQMLRPGGRLFIREGHPVLWSIDETREDALVIGYPYFERPEPEVFDGGGTYVETEHVFQHTRSASWNHGLGEIVTALLSAGLQLTMLIEHDSVPWVALPNRMDALPDGEHRLSEKPWRLPHSYTLQAVKSLRTGATS
jgi:SAM-dependent methyltransferase